MINRQYGFHRDELAVIDDARHLAWGYVAYPPITPFFGRLSLILSARRWLALGFSPRWLNVSRWS